MGRPLMLTELSSGMVPFETFRKVAGGDNWSPEALERHKAGEIAKNPPSKLWRYRRLLRVLSLGGLWVSTLVLWMVGSDLWFSKIELSWEGTGLVSASIVMVALFLRVQNVRLRGPAKWVVEPLPQDFLHDTSAPQVAKDVVKNFRALLGPSCSFRLHILKQDGFVIDPVLEVTLHHQARGKNEEHAVLVWNSDGSIVSPPS